MSRSTDGTSRVRSLHRALVTRVLDGRGTASPELRKAAFVNARLEEPLATLIDKVAHYAYRVTDEDVAAARNAGLSEDQVFELVVCGAIGQATRQYERAMAALAAATGQE